MTTSSIKLICLSLAFAVPLAGCQQMQEFAKKNPELAGAGVGAGVGTGVGALAGGSKHRGLGMIIGAAAGAVVGGVVGNVVRKSEERKASAREREKAEADAKIAREQMAKQNAEAAETMKKKDIKQMVPVKRDEQKQQTTYVLVDSKTGLAGEDAYVFDDAESEKVLADSRAGKLSQLDGQEVVYTPSSSSPTLSN